MQSFGQGRGREVVVDWGGMIGQLVGSSGQVGGYEMVGGVAETGGLLAQLFSQGWGHGLWAGGGGVVNGVVGRWLAYSFGHGGGYEVVGGVVETVGLLARSIGQG